jgi:PAS domain S-box-containing protein
MVSPFGNSLGDDLRSVFDYSPLAMATLDSEGFYLYANPTFLETFGYSLEELIGLSNRILTHPDDRAATDRHRTDLLQNRGVVPRMEKRYLSKTGEVIWAITNVTSVWGSDGAFRYFVVQIQNITGMKKTLAALEESEAKLRAFAVVSQDAFWEYDHQSGAVQVTERFWEMVGEGEPTEVNVQALYTHVHSEDLRELSSAYLAHVESKGRIPLHLELRIRHRVSGWFWVIVRGGVTEWTLDGVPLRSMGAVTAINELKSVQERLIQSSKMVAIGEMAAGIAHEINNPLTIIKGFADLIQMLISKGNCQPEEIAPMVQQIGETTGRISRIIQGLKNLSRDDSGEDYGLHPLGEILDDALSICQERLKSEGVHLVIEVERSVCLRCSPVSIAQVIVNLLGNALHAVRNSEVKWIRLSSLNEGTSIRLSVSDSGHGIPEEIRKRIMDPFFTTKSPSEGTGLGLSICKGILNAHGGILQLDESAPNTTFVLRLPAESFT